MALFCAISILWLIQVLPADQHGAETVLDLSSPELAGRGGFITSQGGAPASILNPAAGGDAQRIVFDAGYLALLTTSFDKGFGNVVELGALFPTKYVVLGSALHLLHSSGFEGEYPIGTTFGGNLSAAKELYPGFNLGVGFNFAIGKDDPGERAWTAMGDVGVRHNIGKVGPLQNFTYAVVFRGLGKSYMPGAFTPALGVGFDIIHIEGKLDKPDPLTLRANADFSFPTFQNMTGKFGVSGTIAEIVSLGLSTGFNVLDSKEGRSPNFLPSIALTVNLGLLSSGKRLAGGRLPSNGDIGISLGLKPLYNNIFAIGPGISWSVGVLDKRPPVIAVDYPELVWMSPNNDGKADMLEFPVSITDQRYVAEWKMEIFDEKDTLVRTYKNKELRRETQGIRNVMSRLIAGKAGVEVPPNFRWDGILDSGDIAPDGAYHFVIRAADDNGNTAATRAYVVMVDNTPPEIMIAEMADAVKIFSPDGDGNKDTLTITQEGSAEDLWDAGIYNAAGVKVKAFNVTGGSPAPITWDGTSDAGLIVEDGVYSYRINATDRALNSEDAALENIIVSTIQPRVNLSISSAWFSPNGDGIQDTLPLNTMVPVKEGITGWSVTVRDSAGTARRSMSGSPSSVPARIDFDGMDDSGGLLNEERYSAELSVTYRNGYVSTSLSPAFTLDVTPPRAAVRTGYNAFSPNNDGRQDEMIFIQEGSSELAWVGEIRRAAGAADEKPVRTMRFTGTPPARITWDGLTDGGALAPDGEYTYQLSATDQAGNSGGSVGPDGSLTPALFALSTADTPVMVSTDIRAFSPNNDRNRDTITIIPQLKETTGINDWRIDIQNSAGTTVQSFTGRNTAPASQTWNGRTGGSSDTAGAVVPDGNYRASIEVNYAAGNQSRAQSRPFTVDTVAPAATVTTPYTLFSPNGDGRKDTLPITVRTEGNDPWTAAIIDASDQRSAGKEVQSMTWTGAAPSSLTWDGTDQAGNAVPDGSYRFVLSSTDEAGNSTRIQLDTITVDARIPRAFFTADRTAIAPKDGPEGVALRFSVILTPRDGADQIGLIDNWSLELKDDAGRVVRRFPSSGDQTAAPPETIPWNGYDDTGALREGRFTPQLSVIYTKGDVVSLAAPPVTVDVSGPELSFASAPEYFSPDNDGVDDELIMNLGARDMSPIANWSFEIHEPEPPALLFYRIEGRGAPAGETRWDGRSSKGERSSGGELVQSATDYPFIFRAADALGNSSTLEGIIGVDVLVIRDGDNLKIQVPSIVFRANQADFAGKDKDPQYGLTQAQIDNNNRVLRRIAQILNKFREYRVGVEGHANPTSRNPPPAEARADLELSERRAKAVVDFLAGFGVSRGRLSSVGRGSTRPVIAFDDRDNWWKNRRVEFILIK